MTYLSLHPEGLTEVFLTGGLPPLANQPDEIYRRLSRTFIPLSFLSNMMLSVYDVVKVVERNRIYYEKYPQDVKRVGTYI